MNGVFASSRRSARQPSMTMVMNRRDTRLPSVARNRVGTSEGVGGQVRRRPPGASVPVSLRPPNAATLAPAELSSGS